ncbi:hypothetical protein [Aeromicrobium sp. 179-A 4D2 NHS]|uniref:hypothetical protein n=1 Tax=Aeromicrobium sp. 179-A 4D2 NHS TaxID=3142375 RepID=UPI0039A0A65E
MRVPATMAVVALALGALVAPGPAHAGPEPTAIEIVEPRVGSLIWPISAHFFSVFDERVLDGVRLTSPDSTAEPRFGPGRTSHDWSTGVTTMDYSGTLTSARVWGGVRDEITLADPSVEISGDGSGRITALVSSRLVRSTPALSPSTSPRRVTVTTFSGSSATWGRFGSMTTASNTPDWDGVLAPDSEAAAALGLPAGQPENGGSFHPEFLGALVPSLRTHFHAGASQSRLRAPAPFTARISVSHEPIPVTKTLPYGSVQGIELIVPAPGTVELESGARASTTVPGERVVLPVTRFTQSGRRSWIVGFTPRAVNLSGSAQTIRVNIVPVAAARPRFELTKRPTTKRRGTATVTIAGIAGDFGPTGSIQVRLTKGTKIRHVDSYVYRVGRRVTLPKLAKGTWTVRAAYYGNANYTKRGYVKVGSFKVTK